jgi:RND family efflux transporter MFP subunit
MPDYTSIFHQGLPVAYGAGKRFSVLGKLSHCHAQWWDGTRRNVRVRHAAGLRGRVQINKPMKAISCALLATLGTLSLAGCGDKGASGPAAPPPPAVVVATVIKKDVPIYLDNVAQTEAFLTVEIRARVAGFLTQAPFREGGHVKQGQLLFEIDPKPYQAIVDEAKANVSKTEATLSRANADVARLRPLVRQSAISQQDLDNAISTAKVAEADVLGAKASLQKAELDLSYTRMNAPFDGMIGERMVDVGNYVGSTGTSALLATVSTVDPMRTVFHVSEPNFLRFQKRFLGDEEARERHSEAMQFQLILGDGSVYPHMGRFDFADRALDARAGTLKVVVTFPNKDGLLRPGQFARVRARPEERPGAILVPQRSMVTVQSMKFVFVVGEGNKVEQRPITTTDRYEDLYVVSEGLKEGERVIVEGLQKVRPDMVVNPKERAATEEPAKKEEARSSADAKAPAAK